MGKLIAIIGNAVDGNIFVGTFESYEELEDYMGVHYPDDEYVTAILEEKE